MGKRFIQFYYHSGRRQMLYNEKKYGKNKKRVRIERDYNRIEREIDQQKINTNKRKNIGKLKKH